MGFNSRLKALDGKTQRFILVGDQDADEVLRIMQEFDPAFEVTGKPNPLRRPKPMSATRARCIFAVLAVVLLGFGALFAYSAVAGLAPNPRHLSLAVVNILLGVWCVVMVWTVSRKSQNPKGPADPGAAEGSGK